LAAVLGPRSKAEARTARKARSRRGQLPAMKVPARWSGVLIRKTSRRRPSPTPKRSNCASGVDSIAEQVGKSAAQVVKGTVGRGLAPIPWKEALELAKREKPDRGRGNFSIEPAESSTNSNRYGF